MGWSGVGEGAEGRIDAGLRDIGPYIIGLKEGGGNPRLTQRITEDRGTRKVYEMSDSYREYSKLRSEAAGIIQNYALMLTRWSPLRG